MPPSTLVACIATNFINTFRTIDGTVPMGFSCKSIAVFTHNIDNRKLLHQTNTFRRLWGFSFYRRQKYPARERTMWWTYRGLPRLVTGPWCVLEYLSCSVQQNNSNDVTNEPAQSSHEFLKIVGLVIELRTFNIRCTKYLDYSYPTHLRRSIETKVHHKKYLGQNKTTLAVKEMHHSPTLVSCY